MVEIYKWQAINNIKNAIHNGTSYLYSAVNKSIFCITGLSIKAANFLILNSKLVIHRRKYKY